MCQCQRQRFPCPSYLGGISIFHKPNFRRYWHRQGSCSWSPLGGWLVMTTFDGRQPLREDNFRWKTTFDSRRSLMEDNLWCKTAFDGTWPLMEQNKKFETKIFQNQNFLDQIIFLEPKIFFSPKFFLSKAFFGSKIFFGPKTFFGPYIFFDPKFFYRPKFLFGHKKFSVPKFFLILMEDDLCWKTTF